MADFSRLHRCQRVGREHRAIRRRRRDHVEVDGRRIIGRWPTREQRMLPPGRRRRDVAGEGELAA
jgi:hypothetical protein